MLELGLFATLVLALVRALRMRHRWALIGGSAALYLLLADTLCVIAARDVPRAIYSVFNELFLGPGTSAARAPGLLPLPALLIAQPLWLRGARIALCAAGSWRCLHESSQLNPLLPRAYALDAIGLPLAGAAVLDALATIVLLFALHMTANSPF